MRQQNSVRIFLSSFEHYVVPNVQDFIGIDMSDHNSHATVLFRLENGSELQLPITINALEALFELLGEYSDI